MEINVIDLMKFLGHSSIYEPFDDYLHEHNIKKRPSTTGQTIQLSIELKKRGLYLSFIESMELAAEGIKGKSPGSYIFKWIDVYVKEEDGFSAYTGDLPFALNASLSQLQTRNILGKPKHVTFDEQWQANVDFYFIDGFVLASKYTDMQGTAIDMISLRAPDNWARENGIAPKL